MGVPVYRRVPAYVYVDMGVPVYRRIPIHYVDMGRSGVPLPLDAQESQRELPKSFPEGLRETFTSEPRG